MKNILSKLANPFIWIFLTITGSIYILASEFKKQILIGLFLGMLIITVKQHYRISYLTKERNQLHVKNDIKTGIIIRSLDVINKCSNQTLMLLQYKFDKSDTLQFRHLIQKDTAFVNKFNDLNDTIKKDLQITFKIIR